MDTENVILEAALNYAREAWPVAALNGKKANLTRHGISDATTDAKKIKQWWQQHPDANIGVRIGSVFIVVDIDNPLSLVLLLPHVLPPTKIALTGREGGGFHYWYRLPPGVTVSNSAGKIAKGIDIKTGNAYVVVPPSLHPDTGNTYTWQNESMEIATAPQWLIDLAEGSKKQIGEGERNTILYETGCQLRRLEPNITEAALEARLQVQNKMECEVPLTEKEVANIIPGIFRKRPVYQRNTQGNMKRFVDTYDTVLHYVIDKECWLFWNGSYWEEIGRVHLLNLCHMVIEQMAKESVLSGSSAERRWAFSCQQGHRIKDLLGHVASCESLWLRMEQLDINNNLLCCKNGTIDLSKGTLLPHRKEDYITKCIDVDYVPGSTHLRWNTFLEEVIPDEGIRDFIQRCAGYSLTGSTKEQKMFFVIGAGGTGKSTFIEAVREVFGSYAISSRSRDCITASKSTGGASPEMARLAGARLVVSSEVPAGEKLNEEIKALTGGEKISARKLYKDYFEFVPHCKVWLTANNAPRFELGDTGVERRVRILAFEEVPTSVDTTLREQFRTDLAQQAILVWLIAGARKWYKMPLDKQPQAVKERTQAYFREQNSYSEWYEENCERGEGAFTSTKEIMDSLIRWSHIRSRKLFVDYRIIAKAMRQFGHKKCIVQRYGKQANGYDVTLKVT